MHTKNNGRMLYGFFMFRSFLCIVQKNDKDQWKEGSSVWYVWNFIVCSKQPPWLSASIQALKSKGPEFKSHPSHDFFYCCDINWIFLNFEKKELGRILYGFSSFGLRKFCWGIRIKMQNDSGGLMLGKGKYAVYHMVFFLQFANFNHKIPQNFMFSTMK